MKLTRWVLTVTSCFGLLPGCGDDDGGDGDGNVSLTPPEGACRIRGTATGSYRSSCNACAKRHCDAELTDKSGSGWAQQYLGGDGACAAYNACLCDCLAQAGDPIECATSACIGDLDAACQAAVLTAQDCLDTHCDDACY